jgi:hypothetical protein
LYPLHEGRLAAIGRGVQIGLVASEATWRARVTAWKASGKRADDFCEGEEYSASLLRHWAWRLGLTRRRQARRTQATVRLARVVRASAVVPTPRDGGTIRIEVGGARVEVRGAVDEAALATVMRVLDGRTRAGGAAA